MAETKPLILIMAGGSGTRFWPLSRKSRPKQFLPFFGKSTLLQSTIERVISLTDEANIYVCALEEHKSLVREQCGSQVQFISEPEGKNTANCLLLATQEFLKKKISLDTPIVVLPADHFVGSPTHFQNCIKKAILAAKETRGLITLGIQPNHPHTGYGYIQSAPQAAADSLYPIARFVEKPTFEKAKEFLTTGGFYWNAGIFIWTLGTIQKSFQELMPESWKKVGEATNYDSLKKIYSALKSEPFDIAIMEKARNGYVIPAEFSWSDVGSWDAWYQLSEPDSHRNVFSGKKLVALDSTDCLVKVSAEKQVALIGVNHLIVAEDETGLLITRRDMDQRVKEASSLLE
jgi:mannose-1-phosphate guanylyltransferase